MCSARSSNDPIFWIHHGFCDKIWDDWQQNSAEHRAAYTGLTDIDNILPASPWTPGELLDLRNQPGNVYVYYSSGSDDIPVIPPLPTANTAGMDGHGDHDMSDPSAAEHALLMSKPDNFKSGGASFKLYNGSSLSIPDLENSSYPEDLLGVHIRPSPGSGVKNTAGNYGQYVLIQDSILTLDIQDSFKIDGSPLFPAGVATVCFKYGLRSPGGVVIGINGKKSRMVESPQDLHGVMVGGAFVASIPSDPEWSLAGPSPHPSPAKQGMIVIQAKQGLIKQVSMAGKGIALDVLKVNCPEWVEDEEEEPSAYEQGETLIGPARQDYN